MSKLQIALPVSQHFSYVYPHLQDFIRILLVRNTKSLPCRIIKSRYRKVYHTNGLINTQFKKGMGNCFMDFLNRNDFCHLSFDCGPSCRNVYFHPKKNSIYWPKESSRTLKPKEILRIASQRIKFIKSRFCGTIALENLDYHKGGAYEYVCDPDFISQMVRQTDTYFAVDIGHILVTAFNLGIKPLEYISRLPLKRIREVHLSHPVSGNDTHGCPTLREYKLLENILAKSAPEFIVLEYYRNPKMIIAENIKLHRFINK